MQVLAIRSIVKDKKQGKGCNGKSERSCGGHCQLKEFFTPKSYETTITEDRKLTNVFLQICLFLLQRWVNALKE